MKKLITILPLFFLLSACGQSGSLYLPHQAKPLKAQKTQQKQQKTYNQQ